MGDGAAAMNLHRSSRLASVVGGGAVAFETTDAGDPNTLYPGDLDPGQPGDRDPGDPGDRDPGGHSMGGNRIAEFAAGRACARRGLVELGLEAAPLPIGPGRAPLWPDGIRGSITHCAQYRGAVVARTADLGGASIGVDAETIGRVTPKLWRRLFVAPERDALRVAVDATELSTIFFSVKEAFYKAQYPLTQAWVGFGDVRVESVGAGQLRLHPYTDLEALAAVQWPVRARWHRDESLVLTGLIVEPASLSR